MAMSAKQVWRSVQTASSEIGNALFGRAFSWAKVTTVMSFVVGVRVFGVDLSLPNGPSMIPTIREGDVVVLDKTLRWRLRQYKAQKDLVEAGLVEAKGAELQAPIRKGDIVLYPDPISKRYYVAKRVVAMPGELILAEKVLRDPATKKLTSQSLFHTIKPDHFWAAGDNPDESTDSRVYGQVPFESVEARVMATAYPLYRWGFLPRTLRFWGTPED